MRTAPGSRVAGLLGERAVVTSLHHQAVADPGPRWRVTARADDGVAEAVEWAGDPAWPALGVQWHPELPDDPTGEVLFAWLTRCAARSVTIGA